MWQLFPAVAYSPSLLNVTARAIEFTGNVVVGTGYAIVEGVKIGATATSNLGQNLYHATPSLDAVAETMADISESLTETTYNVSKAGNHSLQTLSNGLDGVMDYVAPYDVIPFDEARIKWNSLGDDFPQTNLIYNVTFVVLWFFFLKVENPIVLFLSKSNHLCLKMSLQNGTTTL